MSLYLAHVILQGIASIAVLTGVVFAVIQLRETRKAQYVANFSRLVELQMRLRKMRVEDPSLARVYVHDADELSTDRDVREYFLNLMQLSVFEVVWFAHELGQLPDGYYRSWVENMRVIEREPSFVKMLESPAMKLFHAEFRRILAEQELSSRRKHEL